MSCLECAVVLSAYPAKCDLIEGGLKGGLLGFALKKCETAAPVDLAAWQAALTASDIVATPMSDLLGQFAEPEPVTRRLSSGDQDDLLTLRHVAQFDDFNGEITAFAQDTFYNFLNNNYRKVQVGFIGADDIFYGWYDFKVVSRRIIEPNSDDGRVLWRTEFRWESRNHVVPVVVAGLTAELANA